MQNQVTDRTKSYIIRFDRSLPIKVSGQYGDRFHYFGRSDDVQKRFNHHEYGQGSKPTVTAYNNGIKMKLVYVTEGDCESAWAKRRFHLVCPCDLCNRERSWGCPSGDYSI